MRRYLDTPPFRSSQIFLNYSLKITSPSVHFKHRTCPVCVRLFRFPRFRPSPSILIILQHLQVPRSGLVLTSPVHLPRPMCLLHGSPVRLGAHTPRCSFPPSSQRVKAPLGVGRTLREQVVGSKELCALEVPRSLLEKNMFVRTQLGLLGLRNRKRKTDFPERDLPGSHREK